MSRRGPACWLERAARVAALGLELLLLSFILIVAALGVGAVLDLWE